jgi:hypothetical protein
VFAAVLAVQEKPAIDVVFAIDCSGSMEGVIESAKQKVWGIVNEIAKAKPTPHLRIGLIGYGNADQWIRLYDLTDDLDKVYENLVTFKVEAIGDEWVGWAIHKATSEIKWNADPKALKIVFVVGNETAKQGPPEFDYTATAPAAIKKDIIVNAIYAGNEAGQETWAEFARLAEGSYTAIDAAGGVLSIATPHDKALGDLNSKINDTYVAYGKSGEKAKENQKKQDDNSAEHGGAGNSAQRCESKAGGLYDTSDWDLVDACKQKTFKLEDVKDEELPKELRGKTLAEKKAYVAKKDAEREEIKKQVLELAKKRDAFIAEEIKKLGLEASKAFDHVIKETIRKQAEKKNFKFE